MSPIRPDLCPLCGESNACGNLAGAPTCWCSTATIPREVLERVPDEAVNLACVCARCAGVKPGLPLAPR